MAFSLQVTTDMQQMKKTLDHTALLHAALQVRIDSLMMQVFGSKLPYMYVLPKKKLFHKSEWTEFRQRTR